jgi:integrase
VTKRRPRITPRASRRRRAESAGGVPVPTDARTHLLEVARHPRDRLALFCLLALGMRREELAGIQIRNFDADGRWVRVFGKGQKERRLPLRGPALAECQLMLTVDLPHLGRPPEPDDYLRDDAAVAVLAAVPAPLDFRGLGAQPERPTGRNVSIALPRVHWPVQT